MQTEDLLLGEPIGAGVFGTIYNYMEKYAVKVEKPAGRKMQRLEEEAELLDRWEGNGIPKIFKTYKQGSEFSMIMEKLGDSLQRKFNQAGQKFSYETVVNIGLQLIDRLEHIHSKGVIHRDLKPSNILLGLNDPSKLYLIDFGLSLRLPKKGKVYQNRRKVKGFDGNFFFGSAEAQLEYFASKKGDYESLTYILLLFLNGSMPWGDLWNEGRKNSTLIAKMKSDEQISKLWEPHPKEFRDFIFAIRNLDSNSSPNSYELKTLLKRSLRAAEPKNAGEIFDWALKKGSKKRKAKPLAMKTSAGKGSKKPCLGSSTWSDTSKAWTKKRVKKAKAKQEIQPLPLSLNLTELF